MLEGAGMLAALYTDSTVYSLLGKCSHLLGTHAPASLQRLARREIKGVPTEKIFSSDCLQIIELKQALFHSKKTGTELYHQRHRWLSKKFRKWGLQSANVIYTMYHENLDFVRWAKNQGARSVVDVFISPSTYRIMSSERTSFPEWGGYKSKESLDLAYRLWTETAELADILICPSEWVAEGVREVTPDASSKIRIVPYGCSIDYRGRTNKPIVARVLFAGGSALRKGLHYLAEAATQLKDSIPELDVRVAGKLPAEVVNHPLCKDLNFLGKLSSEEMKKEFLTADTFVLPSLSEGFAGVVAEAIGAGCPVIVTKQAGSPVEHEREGLVVPAGDASALADAIQRVATDRELRGRLAAECCRQYGFYSEHEWQNRLIRILSELEPHGEQS